MLAFIGIGALHRAELLPVFIVIDITLAPRNLASAALAVGSSSDGVL
jgi:hypothetical protein